MVAIRKPPTTADAGTISHTSISENVHSILMYNVYQFWCFYRKVNNCFGMSDFAAALLLKIFLVTIIIDVERTVVIDAKKI